MRLCPTFRYEHALTRNYPISREAELKQRALSAMQPQENSLHHRSIKRDGSYWDIVVDVHTLTMARDLPDISGRQPILEVARGLVP